MERLVAKYRETTKAQKVDIRIEAQRRDVIEEEARERAMERRRDETEKLKTAEAARIEAF